MHACAARTHTDLYPHMSAAVAALPVPEVLLDFDNPCKAAHPCLCLCPDP